MATSLGHGVAGAEEPREIGRTEFGSEYSDGSSTIVGDSASFTADNGSVLLKIDSARPVERAVRTLQTRYGYVITYEDAQYTNGDDLQDVSAIVVRNYSSYAPGTAPKVIVPKGGKLTLRLPDSLNVGSQDLNAILLQLVRAQAASPRGGHFRVEQAGEVFHVIPTEVQDIHGAWQPQKPVLDYPITVQKNADSNVMDMLQAICRALNDASRQHVLLGSVPMNLLLQHRGDLEANAETARSVLVRANVITKSRLSWSLLYDVESQAYFLNLSVMQTPSQPKLSLTSGVLTTGGDYLFIEANRLTGGPATDAERADAIKKASQYCRTLRQRMVLLPLDESKFPGTTAAVFNCVRDESQERVLADPRNDPAATEVPNRP